MPVLEWRSRAARTPVSCWTSRMAMDLMSTSARAMAML